MDQNHQAKKNFRLFLSFFSIKTNKQGQNENDLIPFAGKMVDA